MTVALAAQLPETNVESNVPRLARARAALHQGSQGGTQILREILMFRWKQGVEQAKLHPHQVRRRTSKCIEDVMTLTLV